MRINLSFSDRFPDALGKTFCEGRLCPVDAKGPVAGAAIECRGFFENGEGDRGQAEALCQEQSYGACGGKE